jgi:hypothetical protein
MLGKREPMTELPDKGRDDAVSPEPLVSTDVISALKLDVEQ